MASVLQEIITSFGLPEKPNNQIVPKSDCYRWMGAEDIEALGALISYLMNPQFSVRVFPALTLSDYVGFVPKYIKRCFDENPEGDWSDSRYDAARILVGWFHTLWNDTEIDRKELVGLKNWLANVYCDSDEEVRLCIVNGALEHLFETPEIAHFFDDWKNAPVLADAYRKASQWTAKRDLR